jgi:outer membrane cobalamin receptor
VNWKITRRWRSRLDSLLVGRRFDFQVPVPAQQIVGGYFTTNVSADYEISDHSIGFVRVDNLFNSGFHEFIGFPNPGVYGRVGATLRFR